MYNKSGGLMKEGEVRNGEYYGKWKSYNNAGFFIENMRTMLDCYNYTES